MRMLMRQWAIATGHPRATEAAEAVLRAGGNAVDAGVAAGMTLGVVHPDLVSFAGVAPIILREAKSGRITSYDGVGVWPAAADVATFAREHGDSVPEGILRTVVPAAPASWIRALREHGTMSFGEVARGALHAARDGFTVYPLFAEYVAERRAKYARFPSTAEIFLPGGEPPRVGDLFVQADLARTIETMIAAEASSLATAPSDRAAGLQAARDAFYLGEIAEKIVSFHEKNGGLLARDDLAAFDVREEPPVPVAFRGAQVYCCGAWCQGISMAETLGLIELAGRDAAIRADAPGRLDLHLLVEILKLAFADREAYVTDPRYMKIRQEALLDPDFLASRLAAIDTERSNPLPESGRLPAERERVAGGLADDGPEYRRGSSDTSHVSIIDGEGNMFSATPSDPSSDTVVIPGTGLSVSSRGSQSRAIEGHLNALAPGKRPRLTPNPILATRDGRPWLAMGTPGGDVQVQAMAQVLLNLTDLGMDLAEAVRAPRVASYAFAGSFAPHEVHPNTLLYEADLPDDQLADLAARGHKLEAWPSLTWKAGGVCVAAAEGGTLDAVADPRRAGTAKTENG